MHLCQSYDLVIEKAKRLNVEVKLMGVMTWLEDFSSATDAKQAQRNKQALNATTCCIMMADANRNIIFVNDAVQKLLKDNESKLKAVLPNFSASNLVGQNIDQFHKNP